MKNTPNYDNKIISRREKGKPLTWDEMDNNDLYGNIWKSDFEYKKSMVVLWNDYIDNDINNVYGKMSFWMCVFDHISNDDKKPGNMNGFNYWQRIDSYLIDTTNNGYNIDLNMSDGTSVFLEIPKNYIEINYNELVELRNNSELIQGVWYRIIDYETTTNTVNTISANYPFDIIVLALDENTLHEDAKAIQSERDTNGYFNNTKMNSWELKYCLDNDSNRFSWASPTGKGVIYRLIDEFNNDIPFDFKNIQNRINSSSPYIFLFGGSIDRTLNGNCHNNIIKRCSLNNSFGENCFYNILESSSGNRIGNSFHRNTIGVDFSNNIIGNVFSKNNIGVEFYNNTIGNSFTFNHINNNFNNNNIGDEFKNNTTKQGFYNNIVGENFERNSVGNLFQNNNIGNNCVENIYHQNITFTTYSDGFSDNVIGNNCKYFNVTISNFKHCTIDNYTQGTGNNNKFVINVSGSNATINSDKFIKRTKTNKFILEYYNDLNLEIYSKYPGTQGSWDIVEEQITIDDKMNNIIYSDLVELRNNSELIPGMWYRIIDYETITTQEDTQSGGNLFDVIILALSENELSEDAKAIQSERDTMGYFNGCNLNIWKLKYCLDNNTNKYTWSDEVNGKGVIYQMVDEFDNELPYDFKNIQFEHNDIYVYTFGGIEDKTLNGYCYNNKIQKRIIYDDILKIPKNIFGNGCYYNILGVNCENNIFSDNCLYNIFGNYSSNNTFNVNCSYNTFGNWCSYNTIENNSKYNILGDRCTYNIFGVNFNDNIFGIECSDNNIGDYYVNNVFGNGCQYLKSSNQDNNNTMSNLTVMNNTKGISIENPLNLDGDDTTASNDTIRTIQKIKTLEDYTFIMKYYNDNYLEMVYYKEINGDNVWFDVSL